MGVVAIGATIGIDRSMVDVAVAVLVERVVIFDDDDEGVEDTR